MKKALNILLLSFCFVSFLYPQSSDLTKKFKKYIPEKFTNSAQFQHSYNVSIEELVYLEPKLIYYYIKYLDSFWNKKITKSDSNYFSLFKYNRDHYMEKRSSWMQEVYNSKITSGHSWVLNHKINSFYPDIDDADNLLPEKSVQYKIDTNEIYFFAQLPFSDLNNEVMDPSEDYKAQYIRLLNSKISTFEKLFNNASELSEDSLKTLYARSMQYWYLFDNKYLAEFNLTNQINHRKILFDRYRQSYKEYYALSIGAMAYPLGTMFTHDISGNYIQYNTPNPFNWETKFVNLFAAEIKLLIPIKNEFASFSHLEIGAGYLLSYANKDKKELFSYSGVGTGKYITKKCIIGNDSKTNYHTFIVELSAPVFYLNRDYYLELGGEAVFLKWNAKTNMVYTDEIEYISPSSKTTTSNVVPFNFAENKIKILPFVEIHGKIWRNLEAVLKYDTTIQTGLRYLFRIS